jgi:type IV secretion system protein VirB9
MNKSNKSAAQVFAPFAVVLACIAPLNMAWAEATPKAGKHDPRVRHVTYVEGQVYRINTRLRTATLIELEKGEVITTVPVGDSKSFLIEEISSKNALTVKPLVSGARTNAIIETNRRFYILELYESGSRQPYYAVRFKLPKQAKATRTTPSSIIAPHRYQVERTKERIAFKPLSVWDDGQKTYFSFGPDAPIPAVFRADEKGREYSVNSSTNGTTITVPKRAERWVLRHGDVSICISANGAGDVK